MSESSERTPEQDIAHRDALARQATNALYSTVCVIAKAVELEHYCILNWPQIRQYVDEQVVTIAECSGLTKEELEATP